MDIEPRIHITCKRLLARGDILRAKTLLIRLFGKANAQGVYDHIEAEIRREADLLTLASYMKLGRLNAYDNTNIVGKLRQG